MKGNKMTILNLTTFLNVCKNSLVYYKQAEYNMFTNGIVLYACKDDNPNFPKLVDNITNDSTGKNKTTFEPIIEALNNKPRAYVVDHIKKSATTIAITDFDETKGTTLEIDNRYIRAIKKNTKKVFFITSIYFPIKSIDCYFSQSLTQDEFIFIMPITKK